MLSLGFTGGKLRQAGNRKISNDITQEQLHDDPKAEKPLDGQSKGVLRLTTPSRVVAMSLSSLPAQFGLVSGQ